MEASREEIEHLCEKHMTGFNNVNQTRYYEFRVDNILNLLHELTDQSKEVSELTDEKIEVFVSSNFDDEWGSSELLKEVKKRMHSMMVGTAKWARDYKIEEQPDSEIEYKQGDWTRYRGLEKGEIIANDDEVLIDDKGWRKTTMGGYTAPDPAVVSNRIYRRLK